MASIKLQENFEDKEHTTYIGLDDVCNRKQKASRERISKEEKQKIIQRVNGRKKYNRKKWLFHTVAHLSAPQQQHYSLTAANLKTIWPRLMALLLNNKQQQEYFVFLVDGHNTLQKFINARTRWLKSSTVLDWYHLDKKVDKQIAMGMYRNLKRHQLKSKIVQLLWYGLVDQAQQMIRTIEDNSIKKKQCLEDLIAYLQTNKSNIRNYALRKELGLHNSSNRVEKENDNLIARRQKNSNSSFTRKGSDALATLAALKENDEIFIWLENDAIPLKLAA